MSEAVVYVSAIAFILCIFPVHVFNYVYVTTQQDYASINVSLYRLIPIFKGTTRLSLKALKPNKEEEPDDDGKDGLKLKYPRHYLDLYNKLCITKIIQVSDFGIQNENNSYAALAQYAVTQAVYSFVKINGGRTKLRNYVVLNNEHGNVNYYLKLVGVINLTSLARLFIIYIWSVINERKNKKGSN